MKTLYESILSSTNSGRENYIKGWVNSNIHCGWGGDAEFEIEIERDNRINLTPKHQDPFTVMDDEPIPSDIKFGIIKGYGMRFGKNLSKMTDEQMPISAPDFAISGDAREIKNLTFNITKTNTAFWHGVNLVSYHHYLRVFKNITINCDKNDSARLDLSNSEVTTSSIETVKSENLSFLCIDGTPAADTYRKQMSAELKDKGARYASVQDVDAALKKVMKKILANMPNLDRISLSQKISYVCRNDVWKRV